MSCQDWRLEGDWLKNCNCAFGCPCDFLAPPTEGECLGFLGMHIASGHFGDTRLDGLSFFVVVKFPGPLHEGNGDAQPLIDESASPEQLEALSEILSGAHSNEGTLFHIFSLIVARLHDPIIASIEFEFDMAGRTARIEIPGALSSRVTPIRNPVTEEPHRIRVVMPEGFEHLEGEVASADIDSTGDLAFTTRGSHSTLAHVIQTPQGVVA
ncbi:DUF1326 domain-containing protein [Halomonas elongata]|uniref:DUF1326 domain protein n=1 Tax=Halomonas elongata (strain ATCC 33173 / DSM 2581 / NBRC 15536 / NCIMB 2198 / 1H9) TaxID=768066 RepID=E1V9C8_HALED|nr:DUF1326 domain-containing protein [Halomonas elongata]WBF17538.1 DUF1326 domain-containing protein [Halomonas elongata]WPU46377.1 DUF1326 domain-containing protein [Halomonas elongata DSM 2581]CBV43800.1 DUF1326 domain protein [Halomonas elongata DSM 2581]